jgi:hypothetical protein
MAGKLIHLDKLPKFESAEELDRRNQLRGYRMQYLPGMPPDHKVVGRDRDGRPITAGEVEKVFNECYLIDYVKGKGTFAEHTGPREEDVLALAMELFTAGLDGEQIEERKLVVVPR